MTAGSAEAAVDLLLTRLRQTFGCLTSQPLIATGRRTADHTIVIRFAPFSSPTRLRSTQALRAVNLSLMLEYFIERVAEVRPEYRMRLIAYAYTLLDLDEREFLAWHWHPHGANRITYPHLHMTAQNSPMFLGRGLHPLKIDDLHVPTGWTPPELIVRFLIEELDIQPRTDDWPTILETNSAVARHDFPDED